MKKIFAILLTLVMVISLFAGCDINHDPDPTTAPTEVTTDPTGETTVEDNTIPDETEAPVETTVPETEAPTEAPTEASTEPEETTHKHSYTSKTTKSATCTAEGEKTYTCSCGDTYTESIDKTGHDYTSKVTTAATCTTDGVKTYTCRNCNHAYTESITGTHDYECTDIRPATCSNTGDKTYTCKTCGNSYKETLPKNEHVWSEWTVTIEPTTTTYGKKVRTCELCYGAQEVSIDPLPADETEPPATDDGGNSGNNGYNCVMSGHKYGDWAVTKEPTETEYGEETRTCAACGNVKTRQIDKLSDIITDCNDEGMSHTMSAADAAKITRGDNYYKIVCRCGRACVGSDRDAALAKFNTHAAEKQYNYCGEIMRESLNHYHNIPSNKIVCAVCGKTVDYMDCSQKCWGYGDRAECAYD